MEQLASFSTKLILTQLIQLTHDQNLRDSSIEIYSENVLAFIVFLVLSQVQ